MSPALRTRDERGSGVLSTTMGVGVFLTLLLLAVLVLYPFAVLLTSSFFTGQPGRLGNFTLANYAVWLGSWDLLPIMLNSLVYSGARLAIGLCFALLFAWAVARTDVPFAGLMG